MKVFLSSKFILFFSFSLLFVACFSQNPIVEVDCGPIQGVSDPNLKGLFSFLGIPFAVPPIGKLRWQPSIPLSRQAG